MSKLDDIVNGISVPVANLNYELTNVDKTDLKQEVKDLMLELIGEKETHWTDHFGDEHNVPTDGMNARNSLRDELRQKVSEL